jgi:hypothetical protein
MVRRLSDPLPFSTFLEAGEIYSHGRNDVPVWHKNRDFTVIARFTRLQVYHWPGLTLH